jgi:arsenate reductase
LTKVKVLFLCTGNSARSQIAEAFLRKYGGDEFEAYSAGLEPKGIHPYTESVMEEVGVGLSGQYSKHVREYMGKVHFAYVITLCADAEASCPTTFPGIGQRLHWSFEDPAAFVDRMKSRPNFEKRDQPERTKEYVRQQKDSMFPALSM